MAIDRKYGDLEIEGIPLDEPVFVIRAQDKVSPKAIAAYLKLCMMEGSPRQHLERVLDAHDQFVEWQAQNAAALKVPD